MKTIDLEGKALDWAVAKALGIDVYFDVNNNPVFDAGFDGICSARFSSRYDRGGYIIDYNNIGIQSYIDNKGNVFWVATYPSFSGKAHAAQGKTLLIAAMRCFVLDKLGEEVELPEELKE